MSFVLRVVAVLLIVVGTSVAMAWAWDRSDALTAASTPVRTP